MLESALGTDLDRFGDYQTRLVKLNPKLGSQLGEGGAPAAPTTANTPSAPLVTAPTGIPAPDQGEAATPGASTCSLLVFLPVGSSLLFEFASQVVRVYAKHSHQVRLQQPVIL